MNISPATEDLECIVRGVTVKTFELGGGLVKLSDSSDSDERSGMRDGTGATGVVTELPPCEDAVDDTDPSTSHASEIWSPKADADRGCACLPLFFRERLFSFSGEPHGDPGASPGRYVLPGHPRAGRAQVFGSTTMGERS